MMRTRLLWFGIGFTSASATIGQFVLKDIWANSQFISSQLKEKFGDLDARVSKLEVPNSSTPHQIWPMDVKRIIDIIVSKQRRMCSKLR